MLLMMKMKLVGVFAGHTAQPVITAACPTNKGQKIKRGFLMNCV